MLAEGNLLRAFFIYNPTVGRYLSTRDYRAAISVIAISVLLYEDVAKK